MNYRDTFDFIVDKYNLANQAGYAPGTIAEKVIEIPNTTRDTLAQIFAELKFNVGAEVGVERGLYSEVLCKANPDLKLSSVDAWTAYKGYRDHVTQSKLDGIYEDAKRRLSPFNATLIKGFSMDVVKQFEDESLDFVYIDGNHEFTHVVNDLSEWQKKVKVGGIVAGHDYIKRIRNGYLMHVPMAVHGYLDSYDIRPLFILGRRHAEDNLDPAKGELRESTRSWFYVKPPKPVIVPGHKTHS